MDPKWLRSRRDRESIVEIGTRLYEHDRDAFASVLGSAIALRLFLFIVPANLALIGAVGMVGVDSFLGSALESSITTGELAANHLDDTFWRSLWLFLSGMALTLWAGRSLVRVMATCSASAWHLPARAAKVNLKGIAGITLLFVAFTAMGATFGWIRTVGNLPVSFVAWLGVIATAGAIWFVVQVLLPRGTTDPGAAIPGAVIMGSALAVLQWAMQIYLPGRIERSEDTYGNLAATVAALGYFFAIGRLISTTLVVNAFVYERWGSVSTPFFQLPVVRRFPQRWPWIAKYFALGEKGSDEPAGASLFETPTDSET